jgi:hypothetical protein
MIAVVGFLFLFVLPLLYGISSYQRHRIVLRAGVAVIGGLLILPAIVGACAPRGYGRRRVMSGLDLWR